MLAVPYVSPRVRRLGALAAAALLVAGCAQGGGGGGEGFGGVSDASGASDAPASPTTDDGSSTATADGAPAPSDAGPDASGSSSLDASTDAPSLTDAAPDATVSLTGITWPPGQVFPTFAPPGPLDVVDMTKLDGGEVTMAVTLEGLVNRTQPRIWVTDDSAGQSLWLSQIDAGQTPVADPMSLVAKYRSEVSGIVVYDETLLDTVNLACTIAGVDDGIVSSPELVSTLTAPPYSLPVLADLRTNAFASAQDVYQYELDNYASKTTHRLIVGLEPTFDGYLRDYAVATQAMVVWLDPTVSAQSTLLGQFLSLLSPTSPYLGWWTNEPSGVSQASNNGIPVFAADWSMNLTVLGGTPRGSTPPFVPPQPPLENKIYVAIFMSDGDNLQEDEGLIPLKWGEPQRGSVPISWTVDPALVDVAPLILQYYQRTATVNDLLVSGPSGLGYTYPAAWPSTATFDEYAQVSGSYMSTAGLTVATVWNNGADLSAANAQSYVNHVPNLLGLTMQSSSTALEYIGNDIPVVELTVSYGSDAADLESGISTALSSYDGTAPVFAAVQGDMNESTIDPSAFAATQADYGTNTNVVFVRGDHFFQLMARAHAPPAHRVWSGDVNGDGKTDSLFYYAGNGDFWFGISNGTVLTWSRATNVASQFSDYASFLGPGYAFYQGDFNGDGMQDLTFYRASDGTWWFGLSNGTSLTFTQANSDPGFGNLLDGKHDIRVGDYDGDGKTDVEFYSEPDGNWWLGISNGSAITWNGAGNTSGFGDLLDGSHVLYDGDFNGDGKQDVLFFYNGDYSLWLGASSGTSFTWTQVGTESGFGNLVDGGHHMVTGDFNGDHKTDLLFYYSGDGNWWLGLSSGTGFTWSTASNTPTTTNLVDWNHRIYVQDVNGDGKSDVVVFDAATGDWQVGLSNGATLAWSDFGSTATYGDVVDWSHLLFFGDWAGTGTKEPLFYGAGDGNWSMSAESGAAFTWHGAGNTSGFGDLTH